MRRPPRRPAEEEREPEEWELCQALRQKAWSWFEAGRNRVAAPEPAPDAAASVNQK